MDKSGIVSFKIYVNQDGEEPEIRRFGLSAPDATNYTIFFGKITEVFPKLANKKFTIYWTDEDGDSVAVSSNEELLISLTSIASDVKKFYVKLESAAGGSSPGESENSVPHLGVYCDGCGSDIAGSRYKCLRCRNYDLCGGCERAGIHSEHPMLKIPHPLCFDQLSLKKLMEFTAATIPLNVEHHRRHHSRDGGHSDSHKKKKRSERRESGPDTGDEMDDGCHKKHSHKKCRKQNSCPYSQMLNYFNPMNFQPRFDVFDETSKKPQEESGSHMAYLKTVGSTIQKLLDPLGVNVEFEVRPNGENLQEKKGEEKGKKKEEEKGKKKEEEKNKEEEKGQPTPSAPAQKEVRFAPSDIFNQGLDEITKILANQSMGNSNSGTSSQSSRTSPENDGWVSFEELKKETEESQSGSSGQSVPKESNLPTEKPGTSEQAQNLYPNLESYQSVSPAVRKSLEKMLSMGFTNEGNWLTYLLEAKQGDIDQALEMLTPHKKK